jgi:XTP/dITP diphosphohydrolase
VRVLVASANQSKIKELRRMLEPLRIELIHLDENECTELVETGATFEENALLKARFYHAKTAMPTIADDSGLEVDALGGAPGLLSARYGGPSVTDEDRVDKLLEELRDIPEPDRGARFVCAAAFVRLDQEVTFAGEVRGRILREPRGENGFGYDPVFLYQPLDLTFAEMTAEQKQEVSHRGRALRGFSQWLIDSGLLDTVKSDDRISFPQ